MKFAAIVSLIVAFAAHLSAQSYPPAWSSASSYAIGDQVQLNGNVIRAVRAVSPGGFKYAYWELWDVRANTTILIGAGGQFPTLVAAWNYTLNCRIAQGASLKLSILAGHTENISGSFSLDHPFGARMAITGPSGGSATLNFLAQANGFEIDSGHTFGGLSNFQMNGPSGGTAGFPAIVATQNSVLCGVSNVTISNFSAGFVTLTSGTIDNVSGIQLNQFLYGAHANGNGVINFSGVVVFDGKNTVGSVPAYGFLADFGGYISLVQGSEANNCTIGFESMNGGTISADGTSVANPNGANEYGYYAWNHGTIYCGASTVSDESYGFYSINSSFIYTAQSVCSGTIVNFGFYAVQGSSIDASDTSGNYSPVGLSSDGSCIFHS